MSLQDVLRRGFFPKELPRPFVTAPFAVAVTKGKPAGEFAKPWAKGVTHRVSKLGKYSLARGGLFRRQLSICNPLPIFHLAAEITSNWGTVVLPSPSKALIAATTPEKKGAGRAINAVWGHDARPQLAQAARIGKRYVLQTDITRFYGSIYTHSIPWALHTKASAKKDRGPALLGNRLDYWIRMGQDQQTVGIPIGPDTSLVLSELIMKRCDEALLARLPRIKGYRYIDDYELSFNTRTEAEDAFHVLDTALSDFELVLNPLKTRVLELPLPLEAPWAIELKRFAFREQSSAQAFDLENYFSRAFELHAADTDNAVLNFAVARLRKLKIHPKTWDRFQRLLLLCVIPEPACLPYVLEQIITRKNSDPGLPILPELAEVINKLIEEHGPLRHSSEVANAVWACIALQLQIDDKAVESLSRCEDSVIALLSLDAEKHGLTNKPLDKTLWESHMTADDLYNEHWLLAYEASIKGWLPNPPTGDFVAKDPTFHFLKASNVHFYDPALAAPPKPKAPIPLPTLPTLSLTLASHSP